MFNGVAHFVTVLLHFNGRLEDRSIVTGLIECTPPADDIMSMCVPCRQNPLLYEKCNSIY